MEEQGGGPNKRQKLDNDITTEETSPMEIVEDVVQPPPENEPSEVTLHTAAKDGNFNAVLSILDSGTVNVDQCDEAGYSALHYAAETGKLELVALLLDRGALVDLLDHSEGTAIMYAASPGFLDIVKLLLDRGARVDFVDDTGSSVLTYAASNGFLEVTKLLVDSGASVDLVDFKGNSILSRVCENGFHEVAKLLLERGARTDLVGEEKGALPLHMAAHGGHLEIVRLLCDRGSAEKAEIITKAIISASMAGHHNIVQLFLDRGTSCDVVDEGGFTPLYVAAQEGRVEVAKLLLEKGASVDLANEGDTPLSIAAESGHAPLVQLLLDHGAKVDLTADDGVAPLKLAAERGRLEVVKILVERGANVNLTNMKNCTALHASAQYGFLDVVQFLLDSGATVDVLSESGNSPLYFAAQTGQMEVVKLLLEKGANVNASKRSCILTAARKKHFELCCVLVAAGPVVKKKACGQALDLCLKSDRLDVAEILLKACPKSAKVKGAVELTAKSENAKSYDILRLLFQFGATINGMKKSAFSCVVKNRQVDKVWLLALRGVDTTLYTNDKVLQLSKGDKPTLEAVRHIWTPQSHKHHPFWIRQAITWYVASCLVFTYTCVSTLLVAKIQNWPFDQHLLHRMLSFIAFGWYKKKYLEKKSNTNNINNPTNANANANTDTDMNATNIANTD